MRVCVCVCLCSLCNETPEVSEGHSRVTEEWMGAREEVFLYCCPAVGTVALCLNLSYLPSFWQNYSGPGGRIHSALFNKEWVEERSEGEGVEAEDIHCFHMLLFPVCMCSPYEPRELEPGDCWEGGGGGGGWIYTAPWPLVPWALDPGKSASSVCFDRALRAAQWTPCHVNMCISTHSATS